MVHHTQISEELFILEPDLSSLFRLKIANSSSNLVLLKKNNEFAVFDSSGVSSRKQVIQFCKKLGIRKNSIINCYLTHGHIDHCGNITQLMRDFKVQIWAPEKAMRFVVSQLPIILDYEKKFLIAPFRDVFTGPEWFVKVISRFLIGKGKSIHTTEINVISSSTNFEDYRPIPLPGHHIGHTGYFNESESILIMGDLFDPRYGMKPVLTSPSSDFLAMKESLELVSSLQPEIIVPGHGKPLVDQEHSMNAILKALETMNEVENLLLTTLENEPRTLPQLSTDLIGFGLGPGDVMRRLFIHSLLRYLLAENKIRTEQIGRKFLFDLT